MHQAEPQGCFLGRRRRRGSARPQVTAALAVQATAALTAAALAATHAAKRAQAAALSVQARTEGRFHSVSIPAGSSQRTERIRATWMYC